MQIRNRIKERGGPGPGTRFQIQRIGGFTRRRRLPALIIADARNSITCVPGVRSTGRGDASSTNRRLYSALKWRIGGRPATSGSGSL